MRMRHPGEITVPAILCFNGEPLMKIDDRGNMSWLFEEECRELRARRDDLLIANNRYQQEARDARQTVKYQQQVIDRLTEEITTNVNRVVALQAQLDKERAAWFGGRVGLFLRRWLPFAPRLM